MKRREIILLSILFLAASFYSVAVVLNAMTHVDITPKTLAQAILPDRETLVPEATCRSKAALPNLSEIDEPHVRALAEYQEACNSFVAENLMIFTDMPKDAGDARMRAQRVAVSLKAFKTAQVRPYVIVEPVMYWCRSRF